MPRAAALVAAVPVAQVGVVAVADRVVAVVAPAVAVVALAVDVVALAVDVADRVPRVVAAADRAVLVGAGGLVRPAADNGRVVALSLAERCAVRSGIWVSGTEMARIEHRQQEAGARKMRAPDGCMIRLSFADLKHEVQLIDCGSLQNALSTVMPNWGIEVKADEAPIGTSVTVIQGRRKSAFDFQSWWGESSLTDLGIAGATCGAVADATQAYLDARPGTFGLHCGAVRIGEHLLAFTGTYRAGKSTLVTRLGSEPGCALFCDDILPIAAHRMAMALGVQPRLRLPLPSGVSPAFRDHVARNLSVRDHRYAFIADPQQAAFGTRGRLAAMIILCRQDGARARFHELETSEAAAYLIRQNIADPGDPEAHYDRIDSLVQGLTCLTLVYSDLEDAVALVRDTFDAAPNPQLPDPLGPAIPLIDPDEAAEPADMTKVFAQAGDVVTRKIGSDLFLWQMQDRNFFSLNPVGGAVWALIKDPQSGTSLVSTLVDAFPNTPAKQIEHDIAKLLGQMQARGLII